MRPSIKGFSLTVPLDYSLTIIVQFDFSFPTVIQTEVTTGDIL